MLPTTRPEQSLVPRSTTDVLQEFDRITSDLAAWARTLGWPALDDVRAALGDLEETDDGFVLEVDLPGVARGDIDIQLDGRRLTVTAQRKERERVGVLRRRTRHVGTYHHEVLLPSEVDPDAVDAQLDDGVLAVRLPKTERSSRRHIAVR